MVDEIEHDLNRHIHANSILQPQLIYSMPTCIDGFIYGYHHSSIFNQYLSLIKIF